MGRPGLVASAAIPILTALGALALVPAIGPAQVPGAGSGPGGINVPGLKPGGIPGDKLGAVEAGRDMRGLDDFNRPTDTEKALAFPLGEPFQLGPDKSVGTIKNVYVSRERMVIVSELERNSPVVRATGVKLGTVQVTLVGQDGMKTFIIKIVPDINFIREAVERQFPRANVRLTAAGDNVLFAEGTVESPSDVEQLNTFLRQFVETGGRVINAVRVAGVAQVQLQVCIARVDRTALRKFGVNFLAGSRQAFVGSQVGNLIGVPSIRTGAAADTVGAVFNNFNATAASATGDVLHPEATIFFGATSGGHSIFGFIEALKQQGLAKILATPTLVTLDNRPADFLVGGEQPYPTITSGAAGGLVVPSTEFKPFGTRLTFVPVILGDGKIRLSVIPEVSRPTADTVAIGGIQVPRFETQRVNATVEMETGQTLALGGLLQTEEDSSVSKVPVLGDLPGVGALFRRTTTLRTETELLILVTPRLVDPLRDCQRPPVLPGQETRSPSDCEFYLKGKLEMPAAPPAPPPEPLPLTPAELPYPAAGAYPAVRPAGPLVQPPATPGYMSPYRNEFTPPPPTPERR